MSRRDQHTAQERKHQRNCARYCEGINDLARNFSAYLETFNNNDTSNGPPEYFHCRVIELRRGTSLDRVLQCASFTEYLYALLTAWGMHRADGRAQLKPFNEFTEAVTGMAQALAPFGNVQLGNLTDEHIVALSSVVRTYSVMATTPRLVGNSKALHHLLPDLVPPIDRRYTWPFFGVNPVDVEQEISSFAKILHGYKQIHDAVLWDTVTSNAHMSTSRVKLIDNAICSWKKKNPWAMLARPRCGD